jgi:hypothetical protein
MCVNGQKKQQRCCEHTEYRFHFSSSFGFYAASISGRMISPKRCAEALPVVVVAGHDEVRNGQRAQQFEKCSIASLNMRE